jgi:hypothetical protein
VAKVEWERDHDEEGAGLIFYVVVESAGSEVASVDGSVAEAPDEQFAGSASSSQNKTRMLPHDRNLLLCKPRQP